MLNSRSSGIRTANVSCRRKAIFLSLFLKWIHIIACHLHVHLYLFFFHFFPSLQASLWYLLVGCVINDKRKINKQIFFNNFAEDQRQIFLEQKEQGKREDNEEQDKQIYLVYNRNLDLDEETRLDIGVCWASKRERERERERDWAELGRRDRGGRRICVLQENAQDPKQ